MKYSSKRLKYFTSNPPRMLAGGFFIFIFLGSILLSLPFSSVGTRPKYLDALFTSTSAVCVTGLTTLNTSLSWSPFGKTVILILIQIGGWGVVTIAALVAMALGRTIGLNDRISIQTQMNEKNLNGMVRLIRYILVSSLLIEGVGALLLSIRFIPEFGVLKGIFYGVFHSISAYCNAGFDLFGDSLLGFQKDYFVLLTISFLIITGGLGFSVYASIMMYFRKKKRLNIHAKVVLVSTIILLTTGTVLFFFLEEKNPGTMKYLSGSEKLLNSFFHSVTLRTAGFNSIAVETLKESSSVLSMALMFIGGCPAGTAGGIKTTTFALLILTMWTELKGEGDVIIFQRRISPSNIRQALSIIIIGLIWIFVATFILLVTENTTSREAFFEIFSAFGTVGITMGLTPRLSIVGKIVVILTMFTGRVGTLTMGYAFAKKKKIKSYRELEENIMIG